MHEKIIEDFKLYFPLVAEEAVRYRVDREYNELVVTLEDGQEVMFDGYNYTLRNLPNIDNMSSADVRKEFGKRLRKIMERKHITQEQLAEAVNIQQSNISLYINGRTNPTFATVYKIARALGCSMDDFGYLEE